MNGGQEEVTLLVEEAMSLFIARCGISITDSKYIIKAAHLPIWSKSVELSINGFTGKEIANLVKTKNFTKWIKAVCGYSFVVATTDEMLRLDKRQPKFKTQEERISSLDELHAMFTRVTNSLNVQI